MSKTRKYELFTITLDDGARVDLFREGTLLMQDAFGDTAAGSLSQIEARALAAALNAWADTQEEKKDE